jgi:outer membrane immunogenic protein
MKTMKKLLLGTAAIVALACGSAGAADLPVYKAPPPPIFTWTGFYIGGNIGAAWARSEWHDSFFGLDWDRSSDARFIGGGQIGFNYQFNCWVLGVEAEFDGVGNNGGDGVTRVGPLGHGFQVTSKDTRITTLAARFGYANNNWLFYGKAGGGWVGNNNLTISNLTTGVSFNCGTFNGCGNNSGGWLVGAGFEYAFTNNWTAKIEYDYLGLGNRTFVIPATFPIVALAGDTFTSNSRNISMVKIGFNYLFNWGAPSRY